MADIFYSRKISNKLTLLKKRKSIQKIKLLVMDVDGVLTEKGLWVTHEGNVIKRFDVRDGLGIKLIQENGIEVAFLSGGRSGSTNERAKQLGIKFCITDIKNKQLALRKLQKELNLTSLETVYVGDDLNDLVIKNDVSMFFAPNDACYAVQKKADFVLSKDGGHGAIRELCEHILSVKKKLKSLNQLGWLDNND